MEEILFDKSLRDVHLSRGEFDKQQSGRWKSHSSLLALQAWSAENKFSEADRMTLAAHFVQQALDRNDVCHVRAPLLSSPAAACTLRSAPLLSPPLLSSPAAAWSAVAPPQPMSSCLSLTLRGQPTDT